MGNDTPDVCFKHITFPVGTVVIIAFAKVEAKTIL